MEILICDTCNGIGKIKAKYGNKKVLEDCTDCNGTGRLVKEIIIRPFDAEKDNENIKIEE